MPKSPKFVRTAPKEFRHLTRLSEQRLAEIYGGRLREQVLAIKRTEGRSDGLKLNEYLSHSPKDVIALISAESMMKNKPVKELLIKYIRNQGKGELLPGLRFVTDKELPRSVRHLRTRSAEQLAEIIAKRIELARAISPHLSHEKKFDAQKILAKAKHDAVALGIPTKNVLLEWFVGTNHVGGVTKSQVVRELISDERLRKKKMGK